MANATTLAPLPQPNVRHGAPAGDGVSYSYAAWYKTADQTIRTGNFPALSVNGDKVLTSSNNLSDVASPATALANLGGLADPGAWTSYTPGATPAAGAFGSVATVGKFIKLGKTIHFLAVVNIANIGTASGNFSIGLPAQAVNLSVFMARETAVDGFSGHATVMVGASTADVEKYDNTFLGKTGYVIVINGTYETS